METVLNGLTEWIMGVLIQLVLKLEKSIWSKLIDNNRSDGLAGTN